MPVHKIVRVILTALVSSLASEVKTHDRRMKKAVAVRNVKLDKLDAAIIKRANVEDSEVAAIREEAQRKIAAVKAKKADLIAKKAGVYHVCGSTCKNAQAHAEKAELLRSRVAAILK